MEYYWLLCFHTQPVLLRERVAGQIGPGPRASLRSVVVYIAGPPGQTVIFSSRSRSVLVSQVQRAKQRLRRWQNPGGAQRWRPSRAWDCRLSSMMDRHSPPSAASSSLAGSVMLSWPPPAAAQTQRP